MRSYLGQYETPDRKIQSLSTSDILHQLDLQTEEQILTEVKEEQTANEEPPLEE